MDPGDVAELLARAKAQEVSARFPEALVIGADQELSLDGKILDKPKDPDTVRELCSRCEARQQLPSAVAVAEGGQVTRFYAIDLFEASELQALASFAATPTGRSALAKLPALSAILTPLVERQIADAERSFRER
jgi:hypothetical protein